MNDQKSGDTKVTSITNSHTKTKVSATGNQISNMISQDNVHNIEKHQGRENYFRKGDTYTESAKIHEQAQRSN